jgi:hypothetical protein
MKCQDVQGHMVAQLTGELETTLQADFRAHLAECEACREEFQGLAQTWTHLGVLPEERPGPGLRTGFYAMLEAYQHGRAAASPPRAWARPALLSAAAVLLLTAGLGLGLDLGRRDRGTREDALRQQASLALMSQDSAASRLRGLSLAGQVRRPESVLIQTLLDTLDGDPSVNVRLSAVEALFLVGDRPGVREGLVRSLDRQDSPLVQVALIDLLVDLRQKQAGEALKRLMGNPGAPPEVRQRAQAGLALL